jgi:hypothetical protein
MTTRLLVVATAPDPEDELRERVRARADGDAEVRVVAPASDLSFLQWLASDEDRARAEADGRAHRAARALGGAAEAGVGDVEPVIALEDALRAFPADELIVVTRPEDNASWLERDLLDRIENRLGLPVTRLIDENAASSGALPRSGHAERRSASRWAALARMIARGDNPFTALLTQLAVAVIVGVVALVLIVIAVIAYTSQR